MSILDKIGEKVFDINWYFEYERPIKRSLKKFNETMDEAIAVLDEAANLKHCKTLESFIKELETDKRKIVVAEDIYRLWKPFVKAAGRKGSVKAINLTSKWKASFGYGDGIVIFSSTNNMVRIYKVDLYPKEKLISFDVIE